MHKPPHLYQCPHCKKEYQLVGKVEVVNKFGWSKWVGKVMKVCKACMVV